MPQLEPTDEELRAAGVVLLIDHSRPGWGVAFAMPTLPDYEGWRAVLRPPPVRVAVDSSDRVAIQAWCDRICSLRRTTIST